VTATLRIPASAKVNLRLRVLGRRADGYHDLDTLFQAIDLADDVLVELGGEGIGLDVRGADLGPAADNLAYRAAARLAEAVGYGGGIKVGLTKRIPAGAGLGGGSSDAAAVLRCLARLLGLGEDDPRIRATAEALGSDVPFFLSGSPLARGTGRGEILERLSPLPTADMVLVSPSVHVSTAAAYAALAATRRAGADGGGVAEPFSAPRSWEDVAAGATNDFDPVIRSAHPEIGQALAALRSRGARFALMSGSGSSVFGSFASTEEAQRVASELSDTLAWPCVAVRTRTSMPEPEAGR
jgi:4-diphosphocytidyl-2-C-methyl-D-erythritol kinase